MYYSKEFLFLQVRNITINILLLTILNISFLYIRQCEGEISGGFVINSDSTQTNNYQPKVAILSFFHLFLTDISLLIGSIMREL